MVHRSGKWLAVILASFFILQLLGACSSPETKKKASFDKGMAYVKKDDLKSAILEFRNAVQIDGMYADARYQLGLALLKSGELTKAVNQLDRAASLDPNNLDAVLKSAELLFAARDIDTSLKRTNDLLKKDPKNIDALILKANIMLAKKDTKQAIEIIKQAEKVAPKLDRVFLTWARIYQRLANPVNMEQALLKAIELAPDKQKNLQALISFYTDTNQKDKVAKQLQVLQQRFPNSPDTYARLAAFYLEIGRAHV